MNPYINATNQSAYNYLSLPNRNNTGWGEGLQAIGQGLIDFSKQRQQNELFELQKEGMQNQIDLSGKQLSWFDRIHNNQENLQKAQTNQIKASGRHIDSITAGQYLQNRFNRDTLGKKIVSENTKSQAITAKNLLDTTAFSGIANSTYSSDPRKQVWFKDYTENYTHPKSKDLSENEKLYAGLYAQQRIPIDDKTGQMQTYEVWLMSQKNGSNKLNLTQTNSLYKDVASASTTLNQFFNELQNYNPSQYGPFDSTYRRWPIFPATPGTEMANAHNIRLRSLVRDLVDKGVLTNQEQKEALSLVDGFYESSTANNRRDLADYLLSKFEGRVENFKNRGSFTDSDKHTIKALEDQLNKFRNYRQQMEDWDGGSRLEFKDLPYKKASKNYMSAKEVFNINPNAYNKPISNQHNKVVKNGKTLDDFRIE